MFNFGNCGGTNEHGSGNCTWVILIMLFICFCGCGKCDKRWSLNINPCTLAPILALAWCCGGIGISKTC
ncbi:MAG: chorion class high-cysteine HCB protein 13 [Clostridia bacterium]